MASHHLYHILLGRSKSQALGRNYTRVWLILFYLWTLPTQECQDILKRIATGLRGLEFEGKALYIEANVKQKRAGHIPGHFDV